MIKLVLKRCFLVILPFYFLTCGIEEFYYIPQMSGNIKTSLNNDAEISIDNTLDSKYNYAVYYRIYISDFYTERGGNDELPSSVRNDINQTFNSDYSFFYSYTDSTNYSNVPTSNTFKNRYYHELELLDANLRSLKISDVIPYSGGNFHIRFPTNPGLSPVLENKNTNNTYYLFRNSGDGNNNGINFTPEPDRYFFYSDELIKQIDTTAGGINNDVTMREGLSGFAYVSMYLVAVGVNPTNFSRIFSKPTHIGIFMLPSIN